MAREQRLHEVDEMGDRDVAVHHHAFELIKRVFMRGIDFLIPEDSAGGDHLERRAELFKPAHLDGRRMGPQQATVVEPERILHVACGVVGRNVESVEVVVFGLDFRPVEDGEAQATETGLQVPSAPA